MFFFVSHAIAAWPRRACIGLPIFARLSISSSVGMYVAAVAAVVAGLPCLGLSSVSAGDGRLHGTAGLLLDCATSSLRCIRRAWYVAGLSTTTTTTTRVLKNSKVHQSSWQWRHRRSRARHGATEAPVHCHWGDKVTCSLSFLREQQVLSCEQTILQDTKEFPGPATTTTTGSAYINLVTWANTVNVFVAGIFHT